MNSEQILEKQIQGTISFVFLNIFHQNLHLSHKYSIVMDRTPFLRSTEEKDVHTDGFDTASFTDDDTLFLEHQCKSCQNTRPSKRYWIIFALLQIILVVLYTAFYKMKVSTAIKEYGSSPYVFRRTEAGHVYCKFSFEN